MGGPEQRIYTSALPEGVLNTIVDGLIQTVPAWDQMVYFDGKLCPSVAFCNEEANLMQLPDNFWATALWHYVVRAKGEKRTPVVLKGTVALVTGDDEFMEAL